MKYGDVVLDYTNKNQAVFLGTVRLKDIWKYRKRDKVRWWLGTDVLTLWMYPEGKSRFRVKLHRIKTKLVNRFFKENWFVSEKLMKEVPFQYRLRKCKVRVHPCDVVLKKENPLVVGCYMPEETVYNKWVYGYDTIEYLKRFFKDSNVVFLRYDGKDDVTHFLSLIDCYIRPSRHDGMPRLILLCQLNNIDFYWGDSYSENIDFIDLIGEGKKWEKSVVIQPNS